MATAKGRKTLPQTPTTSERVEHIADLMVRGQYERRKTVRGLAKRWGVGEGTLRNDAAEASRLVRIGPDQREEYRAQLQGYLDRILGAAIKHKDYSAAVRAVEFAAKLAGIRVEDTPPPATRPRVVIEYAHAPGDPGSADPAQPPAGDHTSGDRTR